MPTTNFQAPDAVDIGNKFSAYAGGAQAASSNFQISSGADLSTILMKLTGPQQVPNVNLQISSGADLSTLYGVGGPVSSGAYGNMSKTQVNPNSNFGNPAVAVMYTDNDGTTLQTGDVSFNSAWYNPTGGSPGNSFWVRYTYSITTSPGGTGTLTPSNQATGWTQITNINGTRGPALTFSLKSNGGHTTAAGSFTAQIASDSGGSNIVYSQSATWFVEVTIDG